MKKISLMKPPVAARTPGNFSLRSAVIFLAVGVFATGVHYLLTAFFVLILGVALVPGSTCGFAISAGLNYVLNKRLTFRSRQPHRETVPRFVVTAGAGLVINGLLLILFASLLGFQPIFAQLLTTLGVLVWNYSINGLWTFKKWKV